MGAGMTGLVAGRELVRRGFSVDIYERWPDVGGQASAFDVGGGVYVDRYYHHLFRSDRDMIELCAELLPGEIEWHRSSMGIWAYGRIWPFVSPLDLLRYGPLPFADRVRLGVATVQLSRRSDWEHMDDIAALDWLRRACGARAVEAVWMPLLFGKFGDKAKSIPLAWLWSKLVLRRQKLGGSGAAREQLGYPCRSFRSIALAIADDFVRHGGALYVDREVLNVRADVNGLALACAGPGAYRGPALGSGVDAARSARADVVLFTTPTFITRRLTEWPRQYAAQLDSWTYRAAVVLLIETQLKFSNTYWTNVADTAVPFLGLIEHTNLVPAERYPARYLYVSNYVAQDDPIARMSADELLRHYLPSLRRMNPRFEERDVLRRWCFREEAAQPVPRVGNRHRVLPFASPRRGVYVANTTQIYPEDRGTNYSMRLGREVAARIATET